MADNEAKGGAGGAANSERPKRDAAKKVTSLRVKLMVRTRD
jgi:hypothetical protein